MSEKLKYIQDLFAPEDNFLKSVRNRIEQADFQIQIGPEEGRLLQVLMKMASVKTVIEIGTLAGYSTVWLARGLPEDGRVYTIERDALRIKRSKETFSEFSEKQKITLLEGKALERLKDLEPMGPFDMIFIDADKLNYANYLNWAEKNIKKGGLIVGDNTLLFGALYLKETPDRISPSAFNSMKEFNERLADQDKYTGVMIPTEEGLTVAVKNF